VQTEDKNNNNLSQQTKAVRI